MNAKDRGEIMDWMQGHRQIIDGLPRVGFRAGNCACFLNQSECGVAFIDHLVKKPGSKDNEPEGFCCILACINYAKNNGFTFLFAFSKLPHIVKNSGLIGFKKDKHKYIYMELN